MATIDLPGIQNSLGDTGILNAAPLPSTGQIGFAADAQAKNRLPGNGGIAPQGPEQRAALSTEDPSWVWTSTAIDPTRWNKRYPYQLLVLDCVGPDAYTIDRGWEFTLPIPPESLSISTPFAISTQVTLGGIVEEHGGHPIHLLNFQGSLGSLPNRDTAAASFGVPDAVRFTGGIAAGTMQNVVQTAQTVAQGLGFTQFNLMNETELDSASPGSAGRGTGYYQFRLLQKFLEGYVNMKRSGGIAARRKRLAVACWKDEAVYVVTPMSFEVRRSAGDALGYSYAMQFKAWRRVALNQQPGALEDYKGKRNDPAFLQSVLNVIQEARTVLSGARSALEAVRGDVDKLLFEPLRQTALLLKDGLSAMTTLADLPGNIARDAASVQTEFSRTASFAQASKSLSQQIQDIEAENRRKNNSSGSLRHRSGLAAAAPALKIFAVSKDNFEVMDKIDIRSIQLRPATRRAIAEEVGRVRRLRRADFERMRDTIQQVAHDFAASIGEGSVTFDDTFARPAITESRAATDEDFDVLFALNNVIVEMSRMAVTGPRTNSARVQAIDFIAGMASRSGIAFRTPVSKFAVPFPYGATLEQVAARYLGSPNRWHEIVALNGLRAPYVDEEGFDIDMITNGHGNQLVVEDSSTLHQDQQITLYSSAVSPEKRRITSIEVISSTMSFVNVDGEDDLDRFTLANGAKIHAFLPDTVNSQQMLYIPSEQPVEDLLTTKSIPGINDYTALVEAGGVDLLLTQSGDAAIDDSGDWKLAIGLANLVQRVRVAFATPRGSLPQHPDFGLGLIAGTSTADLDARQLLAAAKSMFRGDSDFAGVFSASVAKSGPGLRLNVEVGIAGQDIVIPVSVDVTR